MSPSAAPPDTHAAQQRARISGLFFRLYNGAGQSRIVPNQNSGTSCKVQLATMSKPEFAPLLPAGFHRFALDELSKTFVLPFAFSQRRPMLLDGLTKFVSELAALGISGELWFDGSFVSEKTDPDDIDVVFVIDPESIAHLTPEQEVAVQRTFDNPSARAMFNCDVYCVSSSDAVGVSYWRGWFGFKRDGKTPKGIGFISL